MQLPRPETQRPRQLAVLYAIFFVSGFCGLIYESIWSHYLKLLLGHAAYAQAVVLVVFVGGLALGAWLTGRFSERIRRPILVYAAIEAAVAALAFMFQFAFEITAAWAASDFLPAMCGAPGPCSASWLLAAGLILPASILLGSTFPLMSAGVMRLGVQPGRGLSLLYFLNSAGAALGVLGSGFLLLPALGLPGTILLAGAMNAAVAFAAWLSDSVARPATGAAVAPTVAVRARHVPNLVPLLLVAAVTGLSSFIYEVVWIRMLTLVLGAATHSFELMLAPFIFGLAIGAWWIRDRIDSTREPLKLLAIIQVAMGVLAVATLPLYAACYDAMAMALRVLTRTEEGFVIFNIASGAMAAAIMLPATICAGMTLPLITAILLRQGGGERQIGQVYGVNTLGAIAGVLLALHVLVPALGLPWSLAFAAAVDVVLGLALWWLALRRDAPARPARAYAGLALATVAGAAMVVGMPLAAALDTTRFASGVFRHGNPRLDLSERKVVFHRDGKTATVSVIEEKNGVRGLLTNGKSDGSTHPRRAVVTEDDHTVVLLGALGLAHHPKARTAAVIGLGTGSTSAVLLESPHLERLDTIEIEPQMAAAAQLFRPGNAKVFDDPRSRIVIDDARAHFAKTQARYDLVVSEPSNPWVSGVGSLFTVEFYRHVEAHLAPDGHFVQWLHLYDASPELVGSILRAYARVFPEFRAFATNAYDIVLVARNDAKPPVIDVAGLDAMEGLRGRLLPLGIFSADVLAAHDTGRASAIQVLANSYGAPPNSDFFPYVDHRASQDRFRKHFATALFSLRAAPVPILEFATGAPAHAGKVSAATGWMPPHVRARATGWHGHAYLQGQDASAPLLEAAGADYALVRAWMASCRFPADTSGGWGAMVRVASEINPALDAATASKFWQGIGSGKCGKALTPLQAEWVALFGAVGGRDAKRTAQHAQHVLRHDAQLTADARAYATLAAVAANITIDRLAEAASTFHEQRRRLPAERVESAPFRYLAMVLTARKIPPPAAP
jgi:spermidine synthase